MLRQQIYRSKCLPIYQDVRFLIIYVQWGLFYNCKTINLYYYTTKIPEEIFCLFHIPANRNTLKV